MKQIGEMKISEVMPYLNEIALTYGLRLNRVKDLKIARMLFANTYYNQI
jgi:hypothetical protein